MAKQWLERYKPRDYKEELAKVMWMDMIDLRIDEENYSRKLKYTDLFITSDKKFYTEEEKKGSRFKQEVLDPLEAGELIWVNGKTKKKNILKIQAGTRNVSIKDMTGDGLPDILVLTAQSREGVSLFINKGEGKFMEKPILLFDSVYGCSFMEVVDFNQDGKDDIIITNGDNADYSKTLKNYHGVHIFLNDGRNNFKEKYFYPVYGATKTIARDFDLDGDLDLAMIAFYAEPIMPQNESFLYFQNQGNLNFKVSNLNIPFGGRWMVMDAGDADHDGDLDLMLGNFHFGAPKKGKVKPGLQLNYIENKIH